MQYVTQTSLFEKRDYKGAVEYKNMQIKGNFEIGQRNIIFSCSTDIYLL